MKKLSLYALVKGNIIHTSIQHALKPPGINLPL